MSLPTVFNALGDPTRFAIVEQLLNRGEASAGELAEPFSMSKPAVSRHLRVLEEAGVIERRVVRQYRMFRLRRDTLEVAGDWIDHARTFWSGSLDRLEKHLAETDRKETSDE